VKNRAHARLNPLAQMRDDELTFDHARTVSDISLLIAPPLKVSDWSQITDGAAAVVLCETFRRKSATARAVRLICFAHTTDYLSLKKRTRPIFRSLGKPPSKPMRWLASVRATLMARKCNDCF
jgi:acetyl-CoA C-acetyltransferase